VNDFLNTLTPGIIPTKDFIDWKAIEKKTIILTPSLDFYSRLRSLADDREAFVREMADSLLSADDPSQFVRCGFELLGHTGTDIATREKHFDLGQVSKAISGGSREEGLMISGFLFDLGIGRVLAREDLADILLGVQVGLETHRRKNVGGNTFHKNTKELLERIVKNLNVLTGRDVGLKEEVTVQYGNKLSKRVDFGIYYDSVMKYGIEVNFYTSSGSKPTEIKRSYGEVHRGVLSVGVDLIWITDGKGYLSMQKSLKDAYVIFPNIYNYRQTATNLQVDLAEAFRST